MHICIYIYLHAGLCVHASPSMCESVKFRAVAFSPNLIQNGGVTIIV